MKNNTPEFPNFRPYTINDTKWYYDYYIKQGLSPYADINPENLFVWLNINNDLMISELDGIIIIRYTNILDDNNINVIPIVNPLNDSIIDKIMSYLNENNLPLEIHEVPSIICNELDHNKWLIEDDRDSYEYILDTNQQSKLQGGDYSRQRKIIKTFERVQSKNNIDIQYYKNINDNIKEAFLHHINTMPLNSKEESSGQNVAEPIAIKRNLEYASIFHKKALVIRINERIISLSMISFLDKKTAAINHLKVDYSIQDIFRYTVYQLAKILKQEGINEMNIEQDLGIKGIRDFKIILRPKRLLEKKIIRPRPQ